MTYAIRMEKTGGPVFYSTLAEIEKAAASGESA